MTEAPQIRGYDAKMPTKRLDLIAPELRTSPESMHKEQRFAGTPLANRKFYLAQTDNFRIRKQICHDAYRKTAMTAFNGSSEVIVRALSYR